MKTFLAFLLFLPVALFAGDQKAVTAGDDAPSFSLKSVDGKQFDLKTVLKEHKLAVVMFISTECPVSNAYNDRMETLHETYTPKGVAVLAINSNKAEDVARITAHAREHGFRFPILKDDRNKVADLYGAQVTPETYVINSAGKILYHGRIDDSRKIDAVQSRDLNDALDAALAGKSVAKAEAKAIGCSIKRIGTD